VCLTDRQYIAAVTQSLPIVTSYATLGPEGLSTSLSQTNAKAMFVDAALLPNLLGPLAQAPALKFIITNNEAPVNQTDVDKIKSLYPSVTFISIGELEKLGEANLVAPVPPRADDLCCIMYTSGSTGLPKGVPLKHKSVVAAGELRFT